MMKRNIFLLTFGMILILAALCTSCNKNDVATGNGTLKISITDAPFPFDRIDEAGVIITKVELRSADSAEESAFMTLLEDTVEVNLLTLQNGITADLVETDVPAGNYDLLRLIIDHAFITVDGQTYNLKVPSGAQTGIKVFITPGLQVSGGLTSDVLLDFSLEKSFVLQGNMDTPAGIKGFHFKPVVRAVNNSTAGSVQGSVSDTSGLSLKDAEVWIAADTTITTAYSDTTGFYLLPGIPAGTYTLYATKENYDTVMFDNLEVVAGNRTVKDFVLTPIEQ